MPASVPAPVTDFRKDFIAFSFAQGVLKFGEFVTKSGRTTPYFFNAGLFNSGASLGRLGQFYARAIVASGLQFDMLFGPAYKGIALATATAIAFAHGVDGGAVRDLPYAFNRKEAKDHGEGGRVIGAPLSGRVLIVDDVITAGTATRESVEVIRAAGAVPAGIAISLDRMERGEGTLSAVQEVEQRFGMPVVAIATLDDLMQFMRNTPEFGQNIGAIRDYRERYGVAPGS